MLARLRPRSLAGVDHEQEQVDPGRSGDHRAHEPLVPGDVDQRQPPPVRELERRVAELDRDPAPLLLGQPVGVLAGQGPHEPRLAVVDVPGGAYRERHAAIACATSSASASVSVRQSSSVRPSRTSAITGGSCRRNAGGQLLLDRAGEARQLGERQRAAAGSRDGLLDLAADGAGEALGAAADRRDRLAQHAQHRDLVGTVERERERPLERGQRQLVRAQGAVERMAAQLLDEVRAACDDPRLRPAEQLVPREADEVGAGRRARRRASARPRRRRGRRSRGRRAAAARACAPPPRARRAVAARRSRRRGSSTGARAAAAPSPGRSHARSRPPASGSSSRPRRGVRRSGRARPGSGSRRRSRSAPRARRPPRDPPRAPRGRAASRRRCC